MMSSKPLFGPPPPAELELLLANGKQLLSQGAEARIWLLDLLHLPPLQPPLPPPPSTPATDHATVGDGDCGHDSNTSNSTTSSLSALRKMHVGGGIHVPHILHISQLSTHSLPSSSSSSSSSMRRWIIVKERFPKKYRHPSLDRSLTKNRTRGEARTLTRCSKAGVSCPNVLGIAHWPSSSSSTGINGNDTDAATTSSCLFLEWIEGCTVRQYLEQRSSSTPSSSSLAASEEEEEVDEPNTKRPRCNTQNDDHESKNPIPPNNDGRGRITTPINAQTLRVARSIGHLVGKMHAAGIIHGDLTTSNIMLKNPPWASSRVRVSDEISTIDDDGDDRQTPLLDWKPQLALIDFGLASSTTSTTTTTTTTTTTATNTSKNKNNNNQKQQHNAEEKAVDLYVLERAFLSSHPESERLVEELLDGYRDSFLALDGTIPAVGKGGEGVDGTNSVTTSDDTIATTIATTDSTRPREGIHSSSSSHAATMILNRLEQVRMRGRKRECFG